MLDYRAYVESAILRRDYVLSEMEHRIDKLWIDGKLGDTDRDELMALAAENADDSMQVDVVAKLADLDARVYSLEHPTDIFPVFVPGQITKKGDIVRADVTGDGEYDLVLFDGGNAQTSLSIGKINGWYLLNIELEKTHEIHRNDDGTYTLTPINE